MLSNFHEKNRQNKEEVTNLVVQEENLKKEQKEALELQAKKTKKDKEQEKIVEKREDFKEYVIKIDEQKINDIQKAVKKYRKKQAKEKERKELEEREKRILLAAESFQKLSRVPSHHQAPFSTRSLKQRVSNQQHANEEALKLQKLRQRFHPY